MKTFEITSVEHEPNGVLVTIDGFGKWGLAHDDVHVLQDGDHLVCGSWPVGEAWCDDDWCEAANQKVAEILDAQQDAVRFENIERATRTYPGSAVEVSGGWMWIVGFSNKQRWSKRRTYRECIETVYEVVERLGLEGAYEIEEAFHLMGKVTLNGQKIDFDAAVNLMDDEIREHLHSSLDPCSDQEFLDAYVKAHAKAFDGEEFEVN